MWSFCLCWGVLAPGYGATNVMVQDFQKIPKDKPLPAAWVADKHHDGAKVRLSTDQPFAGMPTARLRYHLQGGKGHRAGFSVPVAIYAPVQKVRFQLYGDNSGCGCQVYLVDGVGKKHLCRNPQPAKVDFAGWKQMTVEVEAPDATPTKAGDEKGKVAVFLGGVVDVTLTDKVDFPLFTRVDFEFTAPDQDVEGELHIAAVAVDSSENAAVVQGCEIAVTSPKYCADVKGDTTIQVAAPGYKKLTAGCWQQGDGFGHDSLVATVALNEQGNGSFVFPAEKYPHGPVTLVIAGSRDCGVKDICRLQLYNTGGVSWNEGLPKNAPPAAQGMKLVFADDFAGPLSIGDDPKFTYYDHKPPKGATDFSWPAPFASFDSPKNPFAQRDTYLRIRTDYNIDSGGGILSSVHNDGSGITAKAPCYFECRFIGPNAKGTWPAFWLMTNYMLGFKEPKTYPPNDELDIIEAYGGDGPGHPNWPYGFMVTPHAWGQPDVGKAMQGKGQKAIDMAKVGGRSAWWQTFHVYGCKISATDTIYFLDNVEVHRHPTQPCSAKDPIFFFINQGTGGGWPVDLSRYGGIVDMYVDYVRVYQGEPSPPPQSQDQY
jgi:hypothetical protein